MLRTSPKIIDRDVRNNYVGLWQAYEVMQQGLKGKTREQAAEVDVVSGATRSSDGWKLSVDRAFVRALKEKPEGQIYFEGEHMGVDPQGKFMVFLKYDATKLLGVKVYPMDASGSAIEEANMSKEQAKLVYSIASELLYRGTDAVSIKGNEVEFTAAIKAYQDAELSAKVNNTSKYIDGFYSAYGTARDKGVERADIYVRNGKLVDVKLYRLGANLIDRGDTAYADVVKANAPMVAKLLANGGPVAAFNNETDAISGATESSHSWNQAVERAMEKALKTGKNGKYFDGIVAGVDNQSQILLLLNLENDKVTQITLHLFDKDGKLIKAENLTHEQKEVAELLTAGLNENGLDMKDIVGQEVLSGAAKAAYKDALQNASKNQGNYKDGAFTTYGDAYDKGTNRADVTLRNGNIVGLNLYRVGVDFQDRGASAYSEVVKAIPILKENFMVAATREKAAEVDVVSGATSSSNAFSAAIDRAYKKAEISEAYKTSYLNGIFAGVNADKSVYVMVTIEKNVPVKMAVYYLDSKGKIKAEDTLSADELAVKKEIETDPTTGMHKYAYRPAAFGDTEGVKAVSAQVVDAVKVALEAAGR
ncbi:Electron transport complex subunit RsxG [compost metagenome]